MGLFDLFDSFEANLADVPGIKFARQALALAEQSTPPRIVWVPSGGSIDAAAWPGGTQRPLQTNVANVAAHIWGSSFQQAEALLHRVVRAVRTTAQGSHLFGSYEWITEQQPDWAKLGALCVLNFTIRIPVTADSLTLVPITTVAFDPTGAVAGDGILEAGEN
jgi:hypothetical protein